MIHTVRQRINLERLGDITVHLGDTGERITTFDVHGTRAADPFTARTTEGQGRVLFILDLNQSIQHHRTTRIQVEFVGFQTRLFSGFIRALIQKGKVG